MSVVGFDLGNATSVVALAQKRGIDVLLNTEAKRETPSVVYFGDEQRYVGSVAASKQTMYPKNTLTQLKRLLGKMYRSPDVQSDLQRFPFAVSEGPDGGCLVQVQYCNQVATFAPEQIVAMNLVHLKQIVTNNTNIGVTDCVVSVPGYYTEKERHAMLDATRIAGLNCLRMMDDTAAVALAYGIFRSDLPETEPIHVVFVDLGHTSLQVRVGCAEGRWSEMNGLPGLYRRSEERAVKDSVELLGSESGRTRFRRSSVSTLCRGIQAEDKTRCPDKSQSLFPTAKQL